MAQTVTVILQDDGIIEVKHGSGSEGFAGYIAKTLDQLNNPKGTQAVLMAKARAGDAVLQVRRLQEEKAGLLIKQAADWEDRAMSTTLSPEVKAYLADKARDARAEAKKLTG